MPERLYQIRIPTKEAAQEVCLYLHHRGYIWGGGESLAVYYHMNSPGDTYYSVYGDNTVRFGYRHADGIICYEPEEFLQIGDESQDEGLNIESLL